MNTGPLTIAEPAWRPSSRAKVLWAINAALLWAPIVIAAAVIAVVGWWPTWVHVVVLSVAVAAAIAHIVIAPLWRCRVHRWEISDTAVYTRTGWLTQERRIAPISRIQTVDTERGPLDQMLSLATVTVTTASSAGAVQITALDQEVADRVVMQLTAIAERNRGDAT
ncbi:MAG: PH domain-containing protein [Rhodococcus sp.]|nr:PH domain-containing protein [Rhodococcus sp. (in: high G+C Gram-positive bacteria)]